MKKEIITIKKNDWERLKKASLELDEIVNWNSEHKEISNKL
jgi:hypothetical protein